MLVEATQTFFYSSTAAAVRKGHILDAGHPLVRKFPGSFKALEAQPLPEERPRPVAPPAEPVADVPEPDRGDRRAFGTAAASPAVADTPDEADADTVTDDAEQAPAVAVAVAVAVADVEQATKGPGERSGAKRPRSA